MNPSSALLAASGGDTVKLFDVSEKLADPCLVSYTPSPTSLVNSVKWNHTNLVVASAGDDKKISLWRKNGQSMGTIPVAGTDSGDNIDESILAISFSNKVSRYICTGGSGQVVRIWDLQRKRCIKWLKGHTNTITGAMYNCKDEHLASISLSGDLILHNLASGARTAELKDPNEQVLRVLDYSRISRHLLATAGDDGTVHLWDTTGRSPKASWLKQHSAPTAGISFSPTSDKIIASIGLDKKLYTFDSGSRRPSSCTPYEAPFSSLAFRDDGLVLAAGTSTGQVVFYDVRGKPKPFTVLRAYNSSEAVSSLCWQRSKPVIVNESSCSSETALLGDAVEDSILMPDPLPSLTSSNLSLSTALAGSRSSLGASTSSGFTSSTAHAAEETPLRAQLRPGGAPLSKLHPSRPNYNFKDEMEVFSPLVDVQPITPGLDKIWDEHDRAKKEHLLVDKKPGFLFPSSTRRYPFVKDGAIDHPVYDWKSNSTPQQDDGKSLYGISGSSPSPSSKSEDSSITPPEAWGGEKLSDKYAHIRTLPSRMGLFASSSQTSGSGLAGLPDFSVTSQTTSLGSSTSSNFSYANLRTKDVSSTQESLNLDPLASLTRRFSTYAERISTTSAFGDGTSPSSASPKIKKTGAETRELYSSSLPKPDSSTTMEVPLVNGGISQPHKVPQLDAPQGSSFTLQLFRRTLEETRDSIQKSVHEDIRNLHIEMLRQFHMHEMEMSNVLSVILENQTAMMEEVKSLKKEYQQLRQLL